MNTPPCDHGNTMGYHGQVICVSCGVVVRPMTSEENATDWTQGVVAPTITAREAFERWSSLAGPTRFRYTTVGARTFAAQGTDACGATRRAIVRAAAEIGKNMP